MPAGGEPADRVPRVHREATLPDVRCVLQHWYELRPKGEAIGSENNRRFTALTALARRERRHGVDALRGDILAALRGERALEVAFLPLAAGLFHDTAITSALDQLILRALRDAAFETRIAATYAGAFRLDSWEEVGLLLAERVILQQEDRLLVAAARDVLAIRLATKDGGRCPRCTTTGNPRDWLPRRVV